jgi:hypothetical protein
MAIANSSAGADAGISSSISIGIPGRSLDSPAVVLGESTAHRGASTTTNAERGTVQFPQFLVLCFLLSSSSSSACPLFLRRQPSLHVSNKRSGGPTYEQRGAENKGDDGMSSTDRRKDCIGVKD